ncbi:hypothetical protein OAS86_00080 [Gammaproteobacteria bacterium]|nr:hypothetical protein [Gammaproteobacteria bacterium]
MPRPLIGQAITLLVLATTGMTAFAQSNESSAQGEWFDVFNPPLTSEAVPIDERNLRTGSGADRVDEVILRDTGTIQVVAPTTRSATADHDDASETRNPSMFRFGL